MQFILLFFTGLIFLFLQPAFASDRLMNKRDFERAVILYGGQNQENLVGRACRSRNSIKAPYYGANTKKEDLICRVKYATRLDEPFTQFPVVFQYKRNSNDFGTREQRPQDSRGVYLYRFEAGRLENKGNDVFQLIVEERGKKIVVRMGDVVSWSAIVSNIENDSPNDSITYQEIILTPKETRIHHCAFLALGGCDPIRVKSAQFGLCDGRVKEFDGRGALRNTSQTYFVPMLGTFCEANAIIEELNFSRTVFLRHHQMLGEASISSMGNQWVIEEKDQAGNYRIEIRLSGKLIGALDFEVQK